MRLLHYLELQNFKRFGDSTWKEIRISISCERLKLSDLAEELFRRLAEKIGHAMLLRKGELHRLIYFADPTTFPNEVSEKLDLLQKLFAQVNRGEEESGEPA